jgi:hypothetical protein
LIKLIPLQTSLNIRLSSRFVNATIVSLGSNLDAVTLNALLSASDTGLNILASDLNILAPNRGSKLKVLASGSNTRLDVLASGGNARTYILAPTSSLFRLLAGKKLGLNLLHLSCGITQLGLSLLLNLFNLNALLIRSNRILNAVLTNFSQELSSIYLLTLGSLPTLLHKSSNIGEPTGINIGH